jgi:hypothetical protein
VISGDIVLCHSRGLIGACIRWAQRHDYGEIYSQYNHIAVLNKDMGNGDWTVYQAEARGVTDYRLLSTIAPGGKYRVISLPKGVNKKRFIGFLDSQVGKRYGFMSILSCAFDMVLPDMICLRKSDTWICSGLVAAALVFGGFEAAFSWPDFYTVVPAEIAESCSINA